TYRPEELSRGHPVAALMAGLDRERTVAHVNLDRLDRAATHELLAAVYQRPVPFRVGDAMHQRTGGNPFFLEEPIAPAGSDNPEPTRAAVADHLLGRERRRRHEKALGVLLESGSDDWAALAHHAAGAGRYDELLDVARQGARHYLRVGSSHQALRLAELGLTEAD